MFWDEAMTHLNSEPFGCPPCPQGCANPTRGRQCSCEEDDAVKETWKMGHPDQYSAWTDAEEQSSQAPVGGAFATEACPMCRAKYSRNIHGSFTGYTRQMYSSGGMPPVCYVCRKDCTLKCMGCSVARYCSKACQKKHWKLGHKQDCKTLAT
jgi:hypothetical protein